MLDRSRVVSFRCMGLIWCYLGLQARVAGTLRRGFVCARTLSIPPTFRRSSRREQAAFVAFDHVSRTTTVATFTAT